MYTEQKNCREFSVISKWVLFIFNMYFQRCVLIGSKDELAPSGAFKEVEWLLTDVNFLDSKPWCE